MSTATASRSAVATCSTGKKDYDTPTGVFTILEKEEEHYSKHL